MNYQEDFFREETIDVKELLHKIIRHWELFVIGVVIALGIAFLFNKKTQTLYETSTTILINDNKSAVDPQALLGFDFYENKSKIQNEIEILKSNSLMEDAFKNLDFDISYFSSERFFNREIYNASPFVVIRDSNSLQPIDYPIKIKIISSDSFLLEFPEETAQLHDYKQRTNTNYINIEGRELPIKPNTLIFSENYGFTIQLTSVYKPKIHNNKEFYFKFNNFQSKVKEFSNLSTEIITNSSIIKISIKHNNLNKAVDFLNSLTEAFLKKELNRKNIVADKSIHFIESHLNEINDSLNLSEESLQQYQSSKRALNLDFQTQRLYEQLEKLQNEKSENLIKQKYYTYLEHSLQEKTTITEIVAPSLMNISNPILNDQISNLINLQSELNNLKIGDELENPYTKSQFSKIENSKKVIIEYIQNENKNLDVTQLDLSQRIDKILEKINLFPKTQRELFNFERSFKIYDNIYTFLLQKRSETLLAKASNVPLNEIIDAAQLNNFNIVSKSTRLNYIIALILGILLPGIFVYIKYYFNSKVLTDKDIEKETDLPILGHILKNKNKDPDLVFTDSRSTISESFRMFRTNLDFARKKEGSQVIMVTSTMQGEGKSFVSNNLAHSLAINSKKTILLVFDLRKPKLYINVPHTVVGLTNYLIKKAPLTEIIQKTDIENLDVIQTGALPPNPSELIASENTATLFAELRKIYDYIIIDSPPLGIISEGLTLTKHTDLTIFVVRYNYTRVKPLSNLLKRLKSNNVENINLVTNSLETGKKAYGYEYRYESYGAYDY